jgi:glycerol-3-phosphate dehydrogenase (NAD(P)+)
VARITVFGAGAMGTAIAMHLARLEHDTTLWASPFDERVLDALRVERRHPALPEHLPESLSVAAPDELDEAAKDVDLAVLGAHSGGARTLAQIVMKDAPKLPRVVGIAKGLEPESGRRISEVYADEVGHDHVVAVGGPGLAPEIAQGLPTAAVFASTVPGAAESAAAAFAGPTYRVVVTTDVAGLEYCAVIKNVAAIGLGILDGLGKHVGFDYKNAKAALFSQALAELVELVVALGGLAETAMGLAGLGDTLVTALGGRNRLYGEIVGEGTPPEEALERLVERGLTVEGVHSARDVDRLSRETGLDLPFHRQVFRVLFEHASPATLLELPERMKR